MAHGAPDWWIQGIIPMKFLNLSDTPGDYIDRAGLVPEVNVAEDALLWSEAKIDAHALRHKSGGDDEVDVSGLTPAVHAPSHKSGGSDEVDVSGLTPGAHEASHRSGGGDALAHVNLNPQTSDHHIRFNAAEARDAINDIFGSDGKADFDIDLDGHYLKSGPNSVGPVENTDAGDFAQNAYRSAGVWKYIGTGFALLMRFIHSSGEIYIYTAPAGAADETINFTVRFKLDVSGNLTNIASFNAFVIGGPVNINPAAFVPQYDTYDYVHGSGTLAARTSLTPQVFIAPVDLPHGLTVSEVKLCCYRVSVWADLSITLRRQATNATEVVMATKACDWVGAWGCDVTTSIDYALVDNENYSYAIRLAMDAYDSVNDVIMGQVRISFA